MALSGAGKKKISQNDLRRIMNEQKRKLTETVKKIDSPLAKYTSNGQLLCILCESVVRSEAVWSIHINSKKHRENIVNAKRKKEDSAQFARPVAPAPMKRPSSVEVPVAPKRIKGILKNNQEPKVPIDFFDSETKSNSVEAENKVNNTEKSDDSESADSDDESEEVVAEPAKPPATTHEETLPEGFFDDPLLDAKARNVEYKDPIEEEWEKFQKEIKEENTLSAQIIAEDQEEATAERQIHEIDEQMRNWSRVLDLELKKEAVVKAVESRGNAGDEEDAVSSGDEVEFDEYLDWRAKKSYK